MQILLRRADDARVAGAVRLRWQLVPNVGKTRTVPCDAVVEVPADGDLAQASFRI